MNKVRDAWKSRTIFIFAAIGSAVGLGNAWRFPGLAAKYGGGTFLFVYLVAMFVMGWPLLMMEISLGRHSQQGAINSMRLINKKFEFIGWAAVFNAFFIATYYAVLLAWIFVMIVKGFSMGALSPESAGSVFLGPEVLNSVDLPQKMTDLFTSFSLDIPGGVMVALLVGWAFIYLSIRKGASSAGKIVPYTVIIPIVLLLVLAINGMIKDFSLMGGIGVATFFIPKLDALSNSGLWIDAFGQVFYSLSIMMAIMIAYGSFVDKKSDIVKDSLIIVVADMLISILAGIVLFTTLSSTGMLHDYIANTSGGIVTAFVIYPQALVMLTNNAVLNSIFVVMFYLTLLTLAIDSAFSIIEGVSTAISDKFHIKNKRKVTLTTCGIAGVISLLYAGRGGINWLDIVDNWANSFNLILIGIIECIAIGWFFNTDLIRQELNRTATSIKLAKGYNWIIRLVAPMILTGLFLWNLVNLIISYANGSGGYGGYPLYAQILAGWGMTILTFGSAISMHIFSRKNPKIVAYDNELPTWEELRSIHDKEEKYIK